MSAEETRCKMFGNCTEFTTSEKCNTGCEFYNPKNPDEIVELPNEIIEDERPNVKLEYSNLLKFDKVHEFFVMKKHIFQIQSISPKKIVLKYKRRLKDSDNLADGCYIFKDQEGKLLEPTKVFKKIDGVARQKAKQGE